MISKKTKYAFKAMLFLATKYTKAEPVLIAEIAKKELIPKKFLETILLELKKKGLLRSKKGKGGGYFLARSPEQISFGEVYDIFENPFALLPCLTAVPQVRCDECRSGSVCGIRIVMQEIYKVTTNIMNITTLHEVRERIGQSQQEVMYYI